MVKEFTLVSRKKDFRMARSAVDFLTILSFFSLLFVVLVVIRVQLIVFENFETISFLNVTIETTHESVAR
jgi:hypothetical protein